MIRFAGLEPGTGFRSDPSCGVPDFASVGRSPVARQGLRLTRPLGPYPQSGGVDLSVDAWMRESRFSPSAQRLGFVMARSRRLTEAWWGFGPKKDRQCGTGDRVNGPGPAPRVVRFDSGLLPLIAAGRQVQVPDDTYHGRFESDRDLRGIQGQLNHAVCQKKKPERDAKERVDLYLDYARPALLAGHESDVLWVTNMTAGRAKSPEMLDTSIRNDIRAVICAGCEELGVDPLLTEMIAGGAIKVEHSIRHAIGTKCVRDLKDVELAKTLLHHTPNSTEAVRTYSAPDEDASTHELRVQVGQDQSVSADVELEALRESIREEEREKLVA